MKKQSLLKKIIKGTSIALLASGMLCSASLADHASANANKSATYEEQGIKKGNFNRNNLGATYKKASRNAKAAKNTKKVVKPLKQNRHQNKLVKKSAPKIKKVHKIARHNYQNKVNKKVVHKIVRHRYHYANKNYRHTAAYYKIWSQDKKINQRGLRTDYKALREDRQQLSYSKTKYGRQAYKSYINSLEGHIKSLNWYVKHDDHMLSLY